MKFISNENRFKVYVNENTGLYDFNAIKRTHPEYVLIKQLLDNRLFIAEALSYLFMATEEESKKRYDFLFNQFIHINNKLQSIELNLNANDFERVDVGDKDLTPHDLIQFMHVINSNIKQVIYAVPKVNQVRDYSKIIENTLNLILDRLRVIDHRNDKLLRFFLDNIDDVFFKPKQPFFDKELKRLKDDNFLYSDNIALGVIKEYQGKSNSTMYANIAITPRYTIKPGFIFTSDSPEGKRILGIK